MIHKHAISTTLVLLAALASAETLTVDFADDQGPATYRASGFLGGMSTSLPTDAVLSQIKPRLFRDQTNTAFSVYNRAKALGATSQLSFSQSEGYFLPLPGTNNDWSAWENYVRSTVNRALSNGQNFEYDIWNEPNAGGFWNGTIPQFYETWRRAVVIIRSLNPNAVIVGPSINAFDFVWLKNFLQFAKANNVLPTAVSWHEIGGNGSVRGVAANVAAMRTYLASQGMNISKIYINEFTSSVSQHNPGMIVRFFAELERAKVDGACKSCWNESDGTNNCYYLLDGIVTSKTHEPRAAWWAYKGYADITGRLVGVKTAPIPYYVDGVAGLNAGTSEARAILGRYANSGSLDLKFINLNKAPFLLGTGTVRVVVNRIQNTGEAPMTAPVKVIDADYPISNNSLLFRISSFPDSNAFTIRLTKGTTNVAIGNRPKGAQNSPILNVRQTRARIYVAYQPAGESIHDNSVAVSVCDIRGRLVKSLTVKRDGGTYSALWNVSGQVPGVYFISLQANAGPVKAKVAIVP